MEKTTPTEIELSASPEADDFWRQNEPDFYSQLKTPITVKPKKKIKKKERR